MSEPVSPSNRPVDKGRLIGGIFLGLVGFFVIGGFVISGIMAITNQASGLWLAVVATFGLVGWIYWRLRERDRSLALGLLVGVGCALLLCGTCILLLSQASFH